MALLYVVLRQMMGPAFFSSQRFFGVPGDSQQYMWFIGWMWHAIELGHSPFVSHAFNYPHPITIMDYTSVPALGLLFGWLYAFTSVVFVYNLILVVNYTLIFALWQADPTRARHWAFVLEHWRLPVLPSTVSHRAGPLTLASVSHRSALHRLATSSPNLPIRRGRLDGHSGFSPASRRQLAFYTSLETFSTLVLCLSLLYVFALIVCFKPTYHFTVRLLNPRFLARDGRSDFS